MLWEAATDDRLGQQGDDGTGVYKKFRMSLTVEKVQTILSRVNAGVGHVNRRQRT